MNGYKVGTIISWIIGIIILISAIGAVGRCITEEWWVEIGQDLKEQRDAFGIEY